MNFLFLIIIGFLSIGFCSTFENDIVYGYECKNNKCIKNELNEDNFNSAVSLPVCRIFCGSDIGTLWPKPVGPVKLGNFVVHINVEQIEFLQLPLHQRQNDMWAASKLRFHDQLMNKLPNNNLKSIKAEGRKLIIKLIVENESILLNANTDESYNLKLMQGDDVNAEIKAKTYYGARHGLETLSQLIVYDDIRREIQIVAEVDITDGPVYQHRGLLLDTSRNYFSVKSIKKTIDAMAMTKLNTFHWHITDSQSFPLVIKSRPDLHKLGAYESRKIYTHDDVKDVVKYGLIRGVRVLPEFDAPAHVGEGWQHTNLTVCYNAQPWSKYCVEPPCGQFNPTMDKLYDYLEDIYREMFELFDNPDIFHMGGDEVSVACWNTSSQIQNWMLKQGWKLNEKDFIKLWGHFQDRALERVDKVSPNKNIPIIMWTSHLTEEPYVTEYLNKDRYIIQIWTTGSDKKVQRLLKLGYKLILSNYDALYFDCGGAGWVTDGQNWCSPYIGWQKVYENRPEKIAGDAHKKQILGAEAAIWSEQIDETTLDSRLWPRASALAERLWSDPKENWKDAEARILMHRERLTENNILAEALQPQWCLQNQGECPIEHSK